MFNDAILSEPSADKQRQAVATIIREAIQKATFTYTELLSAREPLRSFGLEYLDGVRVQGTFPVYNAGSPETWGGVPIRLIHVDPNGDIVHPVKAYIRVPGTNVQREEEIAKNFGNIADIHDMPGERMARNILFQCGWPIRQERSGGNTVGTVVEWRWLQKEAAMDAPAHGVTELYAEICKRPRIAEELAAAAKTSEKKSTKASPQAQLGV